MRADRSRPVPVSFFIAHIFTTPRRCGIGGHSFTAYEQSAKLNSEIQGLLQKIVKKESEATQHDGGAKSLATQLETLEGELKPFVNLDADLKLEQSKRDANRPGHERYLGAQKIADDLPAR